MATDNMDTVHLMGFPEPLTVEQQVRLEVVKARLDQNAKVPPALGTIDKLVKYIINGLKPETKTIRKLRVVLMGYNINDGTYQAQAHITDQDTIELEFRDPEIISTIMQFSNEIVMTLSYGPLEQNTNDKEVE